MNGVMKVAGNGQAKILSVPELQRLFEEGFKSARDRALFGICLFTACRISEALALKTTDIKGGEILFRKSITKGNLDTRCVEIQSALAELLEEYTPGRSAKRFLFPGMPGRGSGHLSRFMADRILRQACERIGVPGVSTHSFRRTALTQMHNAGIPLRHIQEISGHRDLTTLQLYLEVTPEQKSRALASIGWNK